MKFTERDKNYLASNFGYSAEEIAYIEKGEFNYSTLFKAKVTERFAIEKLGKKAWLMSIAMASFNAAAGCEYKKGSGIIKIKRL